MSNEVLREQAGRVSLVLLMDAVDDCIERMEQRPAPTTTSYLICLSAALNQGHRLLAQDRSARQYVIGRFHGLHSIFCIHDADPVLDAMTSVTSAAMDILQSTGAGEIKTNTRYVEETSQKLRRAVMDSVPSDVVVDL